MAEALIRMSKSVQDGRKLTIWRHISMAITVAELVAEPQLGLTLLAGSAGNGNPITWAHTSDLPRLWEWVTGGELMMTNGLSIPADAQGQVAFAEALVDAGASALAIGEKM